MWTKTRRQGDRETRREEVLCLVLLVSLSPCLLVCFPVRAADSPPPVTVPPESQSAAQRRAQALKLIDQKQYAEAIDEYQRIIDEAGDKLIPIDKARQQLVQVRRLCQLDLTRLPPAELVHYRQRVDGRARKWLEQGLADRDPAPLRRVVDEAFCSRSGDAALEILGDLAFERGKFEEAERWWRQIARPASEAEKPRGEDDLELLFPDPQVDVARVRAKQILARLFTGISPVKEELAEFRKLHPKAEGRLAGRVGNYADTLQAILDKPDVAPEASDVLAWPTFAGDASRSRVLPVPGRRDDTNWLARMLRDGDVLRFGLHKKGMIRNAPPEPLPAVASSSAAEWRSLAFHPVVVGDQVLFCDARTVVAIDAVKGTMRTWDLKDEGRHALPPVLSEVLPATADLRYTLTVADGRVYARLGAQAIANTEKKGDSDSFLVCLDLKPGKPLAARWTAKAQTAATDPLTIFEGAPVVADGRVFIAATRFSAGQSITSVRCYPADSDVSPPLRWKQDVCSSGELKLNESRVRHHLLALAGTNIVYCTHSGAVVALEARTGRPAWAYRYPSRGTAISADEPSPRDLCPCVFAGGRLYVAPFDYDRLLCLDPDTGRVIWQRERVEVMHLLGVGAGKLVFTTASGIRAVNAVTGTDEGGWMQPADDSKLPSFGRGFLAGDHVYWPVRYATSRGVVNRLHVLSLKDGEQPEDLLVGALDRVPAGNLALGDGILVSAGLTDLTIFVSPARLRALREKAAQERPDSGRARYQQALAWADDGERERALAELDRLTASDEVGLPAQTRRFELLLEQAAREEAAKRWDEADAILAKATDGDVHSRLLALTQRAKVWTAAGKPERAAEVWRAVLADAGLRRGLVVDAGGNPQSAGVLAKRIVDEKAGPATLLATAEREVRAGNVGAGTHAYRLFLQRFPDDPRRDSAAAALAKLYEQQRLPGGDTAPTAIPMLRSWEQFLALTEVLLPLDGVTDAVLFAHGDQLSCRNADSGRSRWVRRLDFAPSWAGRHADAVLVGGPQGVACLSLAEGTVLWDRHAPRERLLGFHAANGRLFCTGAGRLLALDAETGLVMWNRRAPGASLDLPRARFQPSGWATGDRVIVHASDRLWVLDGKTGQTIREIRVGPEPWTGDPLPVSPTRVCVVHGSGMTCLDPRTGLEAGPMTSAAGTMQTGLPPVLASNGESLFVAESRNIGTVLQAYDLRTDGARWPVGRLVSRGEVRRLVADRSAVYCVSDGLTAHAVANGKPVWRRELASPAVELRPFAGCLLLCPATAPAFRFEFRCIFGSVFVSFPMRHAVQRTDLSVLLLDPETGKLVQRVNLPLDSPRMEARREPGPLLPEVRLVQLVPRVQATSRGIIVALDGKAWGRFGE